MRRRLIAAAWIVGSTVPLLIATFLVVGCCVLPFHGFIHRMMPACEVAEHLLHDGHDSDDHSQPSAPARARQESPKRITAAVPLATHLRSGSSAEFRLCASRAEAYRSFIALGALRCDQDVGLHVLDATFLI